MNKHIYLLPFSVFLAYFSASLYVLMTGHLHEDAYILYIFSESFANGNGISYFPGGEPAEGATDFLWMIFLGIGNFIGVDVAVFAAILNGVGLAVIALISILLVEKNVKGFWGVAIGGMLSVLIVFSQIAQASLSGFSSGFYCAFVAICFYIVFQGKASFLHFIPVVGIILGLLRPDGVIIGVVASIIGLFFAHREEVLRKYLVYSAICFFAGVVYFAWRYSYFGNLLPLPLYVKSTSIDSLPGLVPHISWALQNGFLGLLAIGALVVCKERWRVVVASIPVAILFFALLFATQSQNVAYRFQAPGTTLLLMWAALFISDIFSRVKSSYYENKKYKVAGVFVAIVIAFYATATYARGSLNMVGYLQNTQYINYFPYYLSKSVEGEAKIALTEAGRFAYWMKGKKYDLVGLNTPEVALNGSSPAYIEELDPDLIFMHVAGTADYSGFCHKEYCKLSPSEVVDGMKSTAEWQLVKYGVKKAPLTVYEFFKENSEGYDVFSVLYDSGYSHVYLIKKGGAVNVHDFKNALDLSFSEDNHLSYLGIKNEHDFSSVFE